MIGVCDSGLGGITLLNGIHKAYPNNDILFFGDSDNLPYGNKSKEELEKIFDNVLNIFVDRGCTDLVIACNTLCSTIDLDKEYPLKVHDIIKKTAQRVDVAKDKKIIVFSTAYTYKVGRYKKELNKRGYNDVVLYPLPSLTSDIEAFIDKEIIMEKLYKDFKKIDDMNLGAIILGCTHYPIVKDIFASYYHVPIYDSLNLDFNLTKKVEKGDIIIKLKKSDELEKFIKENGGFKYRYD